MVILVIIIKLIINKSYKLLLPFYETDLEISVS